MLNRRCSIQNSTFSIRHSAFRFALLPSPFALRPSVLSPRDHDLLQGRSILFRRQPDGGAGRAAADAGRAAADLAAEVALHGHGLFDVVLFLPEERGHPGEERLLRLFVDHEAAVVWPIALAVAAADAIALDIDLAAGVADDGVGRAVEHAQGVLALPARVRRQEVVELDAGEGDARLAVGVDTLAG